MSQLISAMDLDVGFSLELQTASEPYGLTIHFDDALQPRRHFMIEDSAYLMLALVDNLGSVSWDDPSGYSDSLSLEEADAALSGLVEECNGAYGKDHEALSGVKAYGETPVALQELRIILGI